MTDEEIIELGNIAWEQHILKCRAGAGEGWELVNRSMWVEE